VGIDGIPGIILRLIWYINIAFHNIGPWAIGVNYRHAISSGNRGTKDYGKGCYIIK
jgi:hypothetical protein